MRAALLLVAALLMLAGCSTEPPAAQRSTAETQQAFGAQPITGYGVTVPAIGVSSSLIPLALNQDRSIQVPPLDQVGQAGLYANGPKPGDPGPAVILGHINGDGVPGVFARLAEVKVGDTVETARPGAGTATFTVYEVQTVAKRDFPTSKVYSDTAGPELRLVTCGGELAGANYLSNVIVYARAT